MVSDIVEGDDTSLVVQENPDLAWRHLKVEGCVGAGARVILFFLPQPNCPEAILRAEQENPFSLHRVSTNS